MSLGKKRTQNIIVASNVMVEGNRSIYLSIPFFPRPQISIWVLPLLPCFFVCLFCFWSVLDFLAKFSTTDYSLLLETPPISLMVCLGFLLFVISVLANVSSLQPLSIGIL